MQLEYSTLSYHTGDPRYDMAATWLMEIVHTQCPDAAQCPTHFAASTGTRHSGLFTLGNSADSYYEYVVKLYLLTDKAEPHHRERAVTMLKGIVGKLARFSKDRTRVGLFAMNGHQVTYKMDELACYAGGMYALAALEYDGLTESEKTLFTEVAEGVAEQCAQLFFATESGLAMEQTVFDVDAKGDFKIHTPVSGVSYYILRPETLETLYLTYRLTKKEKYRIYGKRIMDAIIRMCRVATGGYVGVSEVRSLHPTGHGGWAESSMHSFFIAETLKYAFLLFSDDDQHNLTEWVFNTEAHPLKRRKREPTTVWDAWYKSHNGTVPWCMTKEKFGSTVRPDEKYMHTAAGASLQC